MPYTLHNEGSGLAKSLVSDYFSGRLSTPATAVNTKPTFDFMLSGTGDKIPGYLKADSGIPALDIDGGADAGLAGWFGKYETPIAAGLGLGKLGLGYLNYSLNKKGLKSDLADAEQKRQLLADKAANKKNIANDFKSVDWSS